MADEVKTDSVDVTPDQAIKVLQKMQADKMTACNQELSEVLKKYNMTLQIAQNITLVPAQS